MFTFYIPNAFTPNNDGLNDTFTPQGMDFEPASYSMSIFNRWGQEVFRSKDFKNPWDGKDRTGNLLGPGVYAYSIVIGEWTGYTRKFAGNVTIAKYTNEKSDSIICHNSCVFYKEFWARTCS